MCDSLGVVSLVMLNTNLIPRRSQGKPRTALKALAKAEHSAAHSSKSLLKRLKAERKLKHDMTFNKWRVIVEDDGGFGVVGKMTGFSRPKKAGEVGGVWPSCGSKREKANRTFFARTQHPGEQPRSLGGASPWRTARTRR